MAAKIDGDPDRAGVDRARAICRRWLARRPSADLEEWSRILAGPWPAIRAILLDPSEEGRRRRQNNPFCGILTPRERWHIYRQEAARHDPD